MIAGNYLVWIDLEMTGLDPQHDVILEIATIITDNNLNIIATGPALIIHQPDHLLGAMNEWCIQHHTKSGLVAAVRASTTTSAQAEQETLDFIGQYCLPQTAILSGNSIFQDRAFLARYMPSIINFLHYRILDVSTVKELARRWYPTDPNNRFEKKETHRALTDIQESINELNHYRKHFFKAE